MAAAGDWAAFLDGRCFCLVVLVLGPACKGRFTGLLSGPTYHAPRKKVELPLSLSWRVHLRHVSFCFDAFALWIGRPDFSHFAIFSSSAFHTHWLTQLIVGVSDS